MYIASYVYIDTDLLLAESEGGILHLKHDLLLYDGHVEYLAHREAKEPLHYEYGFGLVWFCSRMGMSSTWHTAKLKEGQGLEV
jgi:hypothetical protein